MEEREICELFRKRLHRELKEKMNASVYVSISNDVLLVRMSKLGVYWEEKYPNILNTIINETNASKFTQEILRTFRQNVIKTFFY